MRNRETIAKTLFDHLVQVHPDGLLEIVKVVDADVASVKVEDVRADCRRHELQRGGGEYPAKAVD